MASGTGQDPLNILSSPKSDPLGLLTPKKKDGTVDFTHGYTPTTSDIATKKSFDDLENGFDKSTGGLKTSPSSDPYQNLPPEIRAQLDRVHQFQALKPKDVLRQTSKEEQEQQHAMDSTLGKVKKSLTYVASQGLKGGEQVLKGGSWVLNHMNTTLADAQLIPDKAFKPIDKFTDLGITPGQKSQIEDSKTLGMGAARTLGMMANIAPAAVGGEVTELPKTLFALQGFGQGIETMNEVDPDHKLNPAIRDLYIAGNGAAQGLIMSHVGENVFSKPIEEKIASAIATNALKDATEKGLTEDAYKDVIQKTSKDFAEKFHDLFTNAAVKTSQTGVDLAALQAADYALKKGVDISSDKPVFNANLGQLMSNISDVVTKQAPIFGGVGAMLSGAKSDPVEQRKSDIADQIRGLTSQIKETDDPIEKLENEVKQNKIDELNKEYLNLRKKQNEKNDDGQKRGEESSQGNETQTGQEENVPEEKVLAVPQFDEKGNIDHAIESGNIEKNDEQEHQGISQGEDLRSHGEEVRQGTSEQTGSSGSSQQKEGEWPPKVSKNFGVHEVIDYDSPEKNTYKPNEQLKFNQGDKYEPVRIVGDPDMIELISIGSKRSKIDGKNRPYDKDREKDLEEKFGITSIDAYNKAKELAKQHRTTHTEKIVVLGDSPKLQFKKENLTPEEHTEANDLLQEHGLTTDDLNNEQQERNSGSQETPLTNADAQGVQQPTDDGTRNAGKARPSEGAQAEENPKDETTALDIKSVEANRKVLGKESIDKPESLNMDEEYRSAAKKVDNGTLHPIDIARDVIDKRRTPTVEEFHALLYHNAKIDADYEQAQKEAEKEDTPETRNNLIVLSNAKDLLHEAARNVSYNWGFMGRMLQAAVKKDYSLANLRRLFRAKSDGEIPENVDALLKQYAKERDEAYKALQDYQTKEAERAAQRAIQRQNRASIRVLKGEKLDKAIEETFKSISDKLKAQRGVASVNPIPIEMLPDIGKLVAYYTQKGLLKAEEVAEKIFDRLKDDIHGLTKRDVIDAIAGNGYEHTQKTLDQLTQDRNEIKRQAKLVARLDDIESGKIKPSLTRTKASISAETTRLREEIKKASVEQGLSLKNYKENLKKRLDELNQKIESGDYTKKEKQSRVEPDLEARKLQAQVKRAETKIDELGASLDEKREHAVKKFLDGYTKVHRLFVLSRLGTLAKLTSAAAGRALTTPLEEALGSINAVMPGFRKIAERSPRYSKGLVISDEVKAIAQHFTKEQMKQNVQVLKEGKSDLDYLYDPKAYPQGEVSNLPGRIHAMFKNSTKMAEFNRSFSHILQWEKNNGSDITNPAVQERVGQEAYKLANRSIFMNDNMAVDLYKGVIDMAERKWGNTGTAVATVLRALMPIVKIPTNFALEATDMATLGTRAIPTVLKAVFKGAESLSPKEADFVMRMLRKGEMGAAFMYIAYANPQMFGGYYIQGEKRDKSDLQPGDMKIGGVKIPHLLQHWPLISAMQAAATLRRTQDEYESKGKEGGARAGVLNGFKGIYENVPFLELPTQLTKALESDNATDSFVGQVIKNQAVPGFVQEIAEQTDTKDGSLVTINPDNVVKRKPDTKHGMLKAIQESVMTGIPGWREEVGEKPEAVDKSTPVIKLMDGTELKLNDKQIKERQELNKAYIAKHSPGLTKRFTTEARASKTVKEKIKKLSSYWKEHNIPAEKQTKYKQIVIDDFVKRHIQEMAEKHSKTIMLKKYKKTDGGYDFEKAD